APRGASLDAAAAQAAHDTLAELFPAQQGTFDAALAADLASIPPGRARLGVAAGHEAARQILAWRSTDGSVPDPHPPPYAPGPRPGLGAAAPAAHPAPAAGGVAGPPGRGPAVGDGHAVLHPQRPSLPPAEAAGPERPRIHGRLRGGQGARRRQ